MTPVRSAGLAFLFCSQVALAGSITVDFEGIADSTSLTNQYTGLLFSGANAITAGLSLSDVEFPPRSGTSVAVNTGGPITIAFTTPVLTFGGYFTYTSPITVQAFDSLNQGVGTATSIHNSNFVSSGFAPNELIQVSFVGGIASLSISGASANFTIDDLTVTLPDTTMTSIPEPGSGLFLISGLLAVYLRRKS